jgi:hypothetical protein
MSDALQLHPFEAAGLGAAPFRLVAVEDMGRVARGCSYCGTGIRYVCTLRDRNGKTFIVGTDCVQKRCIKVDSSLAVDVRRAHDAILLTQREAKRRIRMERENARIRAAREQLAADPFLFTAEPHPHEYFAKQGLTLRDYFEWVFKSGGITGRLAACRTIETACGATAGK